MNAPERLSQEDGEKPAGLFDKSVGKFIYNHRFVFFFVFVLACTGET